MVGPDLSYVADHRPDRQWHLRHFRNPQSVSPGSIMPAFALEENNLNDLTSYMLSLKSGTSAGGTQRSAHYNGRTTDAKS